MPGSRQRTPSRLRAAAGAGARATAWLWVLAAAGGAAASDLTGRADLSYAEDDNLGASSEYVRQVYTLTFRRQVTPPTSYQLSFRYQDDRGEFASAGSSFPIRLRSLMPSASFEHRMEDFGASAAYRRTQESNLDPIADRYDTRVIERVSGSVYGRPFDRADVILAGDRLAYAAPSVDTVDQRVGVTFRYTTEALRLSNELRLQRVDDNVTGLTRASIGPRVMAAYNRDFGRRLAFYGHYIVDYFVTEEDLRGGAPALVPVEERPVTGLTGVDELPLDTLPLAPEPRLVDRVFDVSAGISLGPTGASFNNIGLDLGRFAALDELRVHVRDQAGVPVATGGPVSWSVYSSTDGLRWAFVDGASTSYSSGLSAYVVRFPRTSARFYKVVNFGVNTIDTIVTELQPYVHETVDPARTKSSTSLRQGLAITLSGSPMEKLGLAYRAILNADALSQSGTERRWYTDATNTGTITLGPWAGFLYGAAGSLMTAREPLGLTQRTTTASAFVRFQPIERYDSTLDVRTSNSRYERSFPSTTLTSSTVGASLVNRLALYDTLRMMLGGGASRQELLGGKRNEFLGVSGNVHADVRRDLSVRLEFDIQRLVYETGDQVVVDPGIPLVRIVPYEVESVEVRWQPSEQLGLFGRVGYAKAELGEGVVENVRANWSPLPGGAVQLAFDYSHDLDPLTGQSFWRFTAMPRWLINRHAHLQLSYNRTRGTGPTPVRSENVYVTLSLSL